MPSNPSLVAAPIAGLATYCLAHLILSQLLRRRNAYVPLLSGFFAGLTVTALMTFNGLQPLSTRSSRDIVGFLMLDNLTYAALGWCYFHFVNLCVASLRIRILEEILENGGAIEIDALTAIYDDRQMFFLRIDRLTRGGHLVPTGNRYIIGRRSFLFLARAFDALRRCIFGADSRGNHG